MQSKSKSGNRVEVDPYNISRSTACSEPWWHSTGYNPINPTAMQGNASNSSSAEQSADGMSQSDGGQNEEDDDATKEPQNSAPPRSGLDGNFGQEHPNQHLASNAPPRSDGSVTQAPQAAQPPQLELVGHSIIKKSIESGIPNVVLGLLYAYLLFLSWTPDTKETLTIRQSSFGSKCELSQEILKKVTKSGVVKSLLSWADFKQSKDLKKTDGAKTH